MIKPTPINTLPLEILIRIFRTVVAYPCHLHPYYPYGNQYYPRYPDYLAQVCASWRRIAVSTPTLWCHIDLSPNEQCSSGLADRAERHLVRAGELPVDIHIAVNAYDHQTLEYDKPYRLISLISSRVQSLELTMSGPFENFHRGIFRILVHQCANLTRLVLRPQLYHQNTLLVDNSFAPTNQERYTYFCKLDSTEDQIEASFARLTVLHLGGIFPLWSSAAYHKLVDLRLFSTERWSRIREADLVTILKASPRLKILHFELLVFNSTPPAEKVTPVTLPDLQVVKIFPNLLGVPQAYRRSVLRLLAPGTKPLRLSVEGSHIRETQMLSELESFFARSRVESFYFQCVFPPLNLLLRYSADLKHVVLDYFESSLLTKSPFEYQQIGEFTSLPRLRSLYITRSTMFERELRLLLECCPDGIVLNDCNISQGAEGSFASLSDLAILEAFPAVKLTDHTLYPDGDPTADWDILD